MNIPIIAIIIWLVAITLVIYNFEKIKAFLKKYRDKK